MSERFWAEKDTETAELVFRSILCVSHFTRTVSPR